MTTEIRLAADDVQFIALWEALKQASRDDLDLVLTVTPAWIERLYEKGDRVRAYGDSNEPFPAEIIETGTAYGERWLRIKYGPKGKYTTSLSPASVLTDHIVDHPATLTITTEERA